MGAGTCSGPLRDFPELPGGTYPRGHRDRLTDLVIIQGSPRPDGNCGILTGWAADAAQEAGRTAQVIYPHDLDIHCCIGCYQCYNTGTCVFDDDMGSIIDAVRGCPAPHCLLAGVYQHGTGQAQARHRPDAGLPRGTDTLWRQERSEGDTLLGCRPEGRRQLHLRHEGDQSPFSETSGSNRPGRCSSTAWMR